MGKMFPFITTTWNPLGGECQHNCNYCWAKSLVKTRHLTKYNGEACIDDKQINRRFKLGDYVFVQDMSDLFGSWVREGLILQVFNSIRKSPNAKFLLLTKNPKRYFEFLYPDILIPENCVLGCTIESDIIEPEIGKTMNRQNRLYYMTHLEELMTERILAQKTVHKLFISIEPIMEFNLREFTNVICNWIQPVGVAIGYDNYGHNLPEPSLKKTMQLIDEIEFNHGICVHRKTLREPLNSICDK